LLHLAVQARVGAGRPRFPCCRFPCCRFFYGRFFYWLGAHTKMLPPV